MPFVSMKNWAAYFDFFRYGKSIIFGLFFRTGRIFFQRNLATLTTTYLDVASSQEVNGTIEKTSVLLLHLTWIYCG